MTDGDDSCFPLIFFLEMNFESVGRIQGGFFCSLANRGKTFWEIIGQGLIARRSRNKKNFE